MKHVTLANDFKNLLDQELIEQKYQEYMEQNTSLIPHEFVQNHGIHFQLVLRKLKLASDLTTDFFFLSKSSDDWHCVFIEIEKPQSRYFKDSSNELHTDLHSGLEQINRWRAWLNKSENMNHLLRTILQPILVPLTHNPCQPKFVLVHGRRKEYEKNETRRQIIHSLEQPDFKILSFDSLIENLKYKSELYLGIRHNDYIEIKSKKFISENIFVYVPPEQLRITEELRDDAYANQNEWISYSAEEAIKSMEESIERKPMLHRILPKIKLT